MLKRIALAVGLSLCVAHHALHAQPNTPKATEKHAAKHDSTAAALLGTWEGTIVTDHAPESPLRMVMSHNPQPNIAVSFSMNGQTVNGGPSSNIKHDGNGLSWTQNIMDEDCKATAVWADGTIKGEFNCPHGSGTFVVRKK